MPSASSIRPATTGSSAPGRQAQTNASVGSEVILHLVVGPRPAWPRQERAAGLGAVDIDAQPGPFGVKERDAEERRGLERGAEANAQIAVLDLVDRPGGDAGAGCELVLRPPPLTSGKPNLSTEQAGCISGVR